MTKQQKDRLTELRARLFDLGDYEANEFFQLKALEDEKYREENEGKLIEFFKKHIEGKSWNDIHPEDWDFYSDFHKDVYGFRPRQTQFCGY